MDFRDHRDKATYLSDLANKVAVESINRNIARSGASDWRQIVRYLHSLCSSRDGNLCGLWVASVNRKTLQLMYMSEEITIADVSRWSSQSPEGLFLTSVNTRVSRGKYETSIT